MATCIRCGRELPAFSFGEETKLCPSCRQMAAPVPSQVGSSRASSPASSAMQVFPVTVALLTMNLLVFAAMALRGASLVHPDNAQLLKWGADFGPLSLGTQPWRILTSNYVHIGFVHIAVNMWALWQLGRPAERIFGRWVYFVIYTATGISGSLLSLLHDPMVVSAGASGALFGLVGALIAALYLGKLPFPKPVRDGLLKNLVWVAVINLGLGASIAGIDNAGHVGGLVMGLALGAIIGPHLMEEPSRRASYNRLTAVAAVFLLVGFGGFVKKERGYVAEIKTGRLALERGRADEAIRTLQGAVRHDPDNTDALYLLAQAYMRKNDYAHAQEALERVVKLDPRNITAHFILGLNYAGQKQYEDARRVFANLTQQQPNNSNAWELLAASLDGLNREEEAINAYQKAISLNPKDAETYRELGLAQAKINRLQDAVSSLQNAARLDPNSGEIQKDLADVYTVMGNTSAAAAAKRRAEELERLDSKKSTAKQP
jgi:membrane associated rhomboid family serine protease/cytochrome c-type biogenesis protein CcmH/NrfG